MATTTALVRTPTSKPTTSTTEPSPSISPSPGTWRHPKFTEIVQRQSAATFSDRDLRKALLNALALLLSFFFTLELHTV
jgi:nucleoporin POM34